MKKWTRAWRAAQVTFKTGRIEPLQERLDREANEQANQAAQWMAEQVHRAPLQCWFPEDMNGIGSGSAWVPGFFSEGKDE